MKFVIKCFVGLISSKLNVRIKAYWNFFLITVFIFAYNVNAQEICSDCNGNFGYCYDKMTNGSCAQCICPDYFNGDCCEERKVLIKLKQDRKYKSNFFSCRRYLYWKSMFFIIERILELYGNKSRSTGMQMPRRFHRWQMWHGCWSMWHIHVL